MKAQMAGWVGEGREREGDGGRESKREREAPAAHLQRSHAVSAVNDRMSQPFQHSHGQWPCEVSRALALSLSLSLSLSLCVSLSLSLTHTLSLSYQVTNLRGNPACAEVASLTGNQFSYERLRACRGTDVDLISEDN